MANQVPAFIEGLPVDEVHHVEPGNWNIPSAEEYKTLYNTSITDPITFWGDNARELLTWKKEFTIVREGSFEDGDVRWFSDGVINACDNCVDRWARETPETTALLWEGDEAGVTRSLSYKELLHAVCRMANLLRSLGVKKGDRVTIYMPMVPEAAVSMLACARIGAIHSVVFGGFSAQNLKERVVDAASEILICMDSGRRGGKPVLLKTIVDEALADPRCSFVRHVVVFQHYKTEEVVNLTLGRDILAEPALMAQRPFCPSEPMSSEDLLFMLYTSGSTGKPKGIAHTTAGYLLYAGLTQKLAFDYRPGDVFACMADVGWITGHSYVVYGPLLNGATTFMFESLPNYPDAGRYWDIVERHKVTQFYTAPTALRTLMRSSNEYVTKYDRSSLRVLGSVGEPINPEAWRWYFEVVGEKRCPIVDTFWQTETGGFVITPLPCFALKPGSATLPFFGIEPAIMDASSGKELLGPNVKGSLVIKQPWPGMLRTVYGDHQRMHSVYFSAFPGCYFTGDGCIRDKDGYYWITGRVDDVIKVSGHRLGSAEVEHALVQHPSVSEAAVVGFPHEIKGEGLFCFVTLKHGFEDSKEMQAELKQVCRKMIGPVATPDVILITPGLPKTRSGKIMRRILRKILHGESDQLGDISTLADPTVVAELILRCKALLP